MDDSISQADVPSTPTLNVGDRIELTIDDMAFGGEGVGRIDGFVVFVPFVISGEMVLVEITEKKKAFARAKPLQVLEASADRVEPRCEHFGTCGGCQYQHIDYNTQQTIKESQVRDLFERIGPDFIPQVSNAVPVDHAPPSFDPARVSVKPFDNVNPRIEPRTILTFTNRV